MWDVGSCFFQTVRQEIQRASLEVKLQYGTYGRSAWIYYYYVRTVRYLPGYIRGWRGKMVRRAGLSVM